MPISKAILDDNDGKGIYHGVANPKDVVDDNDRFPPEPPENEGMVDDNWRNISDDDMLTAEEYADKVTVEIDKLYAPLDRLLQKEKNLKDEEDPDDDYEF